MNSACHYARTFDDYLAREFRRILSRDKQMPEEETFSPDQIEGLVLWLDASDKSTIQLTYSTDALGGATASGTSGTDTITTSSDVSANLEVGARIRLGAAGAVTTANTLGSDTYTITNIAGTTIIVSETLTANYNGSTLYRGLVSQWSDKAGTNHAVQTTASNMPLWVSNGQNGLGIVKFDGSNDVMNNTNNFVIGSVFQTVKTNPTGNFQGFFTGNSDPGGSNFYLIRNNSTPNIYTGGSYFQSFFVNSTNTAAFTNSAPMIIGGIDSTPQANLDGYQLGRDRIHAGRNLDGFISETIAYDNALSTNARNLIEQYQAAKWGIALQS